MQNIARVLWHTADKEGMPKLQLRVTYNRASKNWYAGLEDCRTQAIFRHHSGRTVTEAIRKLDESVKELCRNG